MGTQIAERTVQDKVQETPSNPPQKGSKSPTEELKYTENQWREMQAKIRKEIQPLKDKVRDIESEKDALLSQVDTFKDNEDVLKQTVADLHGEIEEGIPQDAKEAVTKYLKKQALLNEREIKHRKEVGKFQGDIEGVKRSKLETFAQTLSEKYGVDKDKLLEYSSEQDMKVYALDNMDFTKSKGEVTPTVIPVETEKLPKPETPTSSGGTSDDAFWKAYGQPGFNPGPADHKRAKEIYNKMMQGG